MAAHIATIDASISGFSGGDGATWIRACSPTRCEASSAWRSVSRVGRPCQVVPGKTKSPITTASPTADTTVASSRLRRSRALAISAEINATAISSHVEP